MWCIGSTPKPDQSDKAQRFTVHFGGSSETLRNPNALFVGPCTIQFTAEHVIITGRRFNRVESYRHVRRSDRLQACLHASFLGILLIPVAFFVGVGIRYLESQPAQVVYDRNQIRSLPGDRDYVHFAILDQDQQMSAEFLGDTASWDDTAAINRLFGVNDLK